ncbi:MAG: PhoH family protein [Mariprofundaceae bacterium]|nr:PhoH family protein [Mariprofundaceae bacterium]
MKALLEADDFKSADVKKVGPNLYRSRLDIHHRLLFSIYQHDGQRYALILEFIANHAYEKSRFLEHGASIDESKIASIDELDEEPESLVYLNEKSHTFNILDKVISFDSTQHSVYALNPPVIIIGSAGSGKTALTLEKMKHAIGDVLYVTHSPYLVKNSRDIYYSLRYDNEDQQVDFFSFQEFLESIHIPSGREVNFQDFNRWFAQTRKSRSLNDAHKLVEEFKGVITGTMSDKGWLSRDEYLQLGIKQSIFQQNEREEVYNLFESYHRFIDKETLYDSNIICHHYAERVQPCYDFIIIDEVQDITSVQLALILKSLNQAGEFIICGDSNQIVHPNFFSWSKIKSFFHQQHHQTSAQPRELITVLNTNYRNSPEVTEVANRLLKLKNARFGSIDKESNYLVKSNAHNRGNICFLQDREQIKLELEKKTRHSTRFAIIVMRDELKDQARKHFSTPLVFSVQEAKGLEYENIILYNFVASDLKRFATIAEGVHVDDLHVDQLTFARVKDKSDKSLEIYKFHINAFYVAITRAIKNLYLIEKEPEHPILTLMGLHDAQISLKMAEQNSCFEEWREEARKLELQGKTDQADEIRSRILKQKKINWKPLVGEALTQLDDLALTQGNKKAKLPLFEYALVHHDLKRLNKLECSGFTPAKNIGKGLDLLNRKYFTLYTFKNTSNIMRKVDEYGVDFRDLFNHTPLMLAARFGNADLVEKLCEIGADTELCNNNGFNAFQIALEQACVDEKFAKRSLPEVYGLLAPAEITLQVDGRLLKLLRRTMEFVLLNIMIASFYRSIPQAWVHREHAFNAAGLTAMLKTFPDSVLPHYRKKQTYISSMLSKNECQGTALYNRKIFKRTKRGQYIINPDVSIRKNGRWVNIYELLILDRLFFDSRKYEGRTGFHKKAWFELKIKNLVDYLKG